MELRINDNISIKFVDDLNNLIVSIIDTNSKNQLYKPVKFIITDNGILASPEYYGVNAELNMPKDLRKDITIMLGQYFQPKLLAISKNAFFENAAKDIYESGCVRKVLSGPDPIKEVASDIVRVYNDHSSTDLSKLTHCYIWNEIINHSQNTYSECEGICDWVNDLFCKARQLGY